MKQIKTFLIILLILAGRSSLCLTDSVSSTEDIFLASTFEDSRSIEPDQFDEFILNQMEINNIPGLSACVMKDGEYLWSNAYGYANFDLDIPASDSILFYLGSISKTVLAVAAMQLWEEGLFGLDDNINNYLPFDVAIPNYPDSIITFRMLMTHTSSIEDNWAVLHSLQTLNEDCPISLAEFVEGYFVPEGEYYSATANFYHYPPLTQFNYSNAATALLGYLVEVIFETPFDEYCNENIFIPLQMNETSWILSDLDTTHIAMPYEYSGSDYNPIGHYSKAWYPAGTVRTSTTQLSRFLTMFMNGGQLDGVIILDSSTVDLMTTIQYPELNPTMGLLWYDTNGLWGHTGGYPGVRTAMYYHPEGQWSVIVLTNGSHYPDRIISALATYAHRYTKFSVEKISTLDTDGDEILEIGENIELVLGIKNNLDFTGENVTATLSTENNDIQIINSTVSYGQIQWEQLTFNQDNPFEFTIANIDDPGEVSFIITIQWGDGEQCTDTFDIPIGLADILVIHDDPTIMRYVTLTELYYVNTIEELSLTAQHRDYEIWGRPSAALLDNFSEVIWYTGYAADSTLTQSDQDELSSYLDNGGNLFITGQNINDDIGDTEFFAQYLHAQSLQNNWEGNLNIFGTTGDPIGDGMIFSIGGWDGADNQNSPSTIAPTDDAYTAFYFVPPNESSGCGIRYDGDYKLIYLSFGFEGINTPDDRLDLMERILLDYFDIEVGIDDVPSISDVPAKFELRQNYPNPFNPATTIQFEIPVASQRAVKLQIYDVSGKLIKTLVDEPIEAGYHSAVWNGKDGAGHDVASGVYFYKLDAAEYTDIKQMLLVK